MNTEQGYEQSGVAMTCRAYHEYERMFFLTDGLAKKGKILDVAAGASSFTAEACRRGLDVEAVDPLYRMKADEIMRLGEQEIETSTQKLARVADRMVWDYYGSLKQHRENREQSLHVFAEHYGGEGRSRYHIGLLPELPFADQTFSLVLCSHFLFLYEAQFDFNFHLKSIEELLRVCVQGGEIRLYPLQSLQYKPYTHLNELLSRLDDFSARFEILDSRLPFIPGSTKLLRIHKK